MTAPEPACDATLEDGRGRTRRCQLDDGRDSSRRHYSVLNGGGGDVMEWTDDAEFATSASSSPPRPTARPTRYTVTCVPPDSSSDAHVWALQVEERRDGSWVVSDGFHEWMDTSGTWQDRPFPQCLHDLDTALRLAREAAPHVIVNGLTPQAALARIARIKAGGAS